MKRAKQKGNKGKALPAFKEDEDMDKHDQRVANMQKKLLLK